VPGHIGALPVAYRTREAEPTFQSLTDPAFAPLYPDGRAFPVALDAFMTTRYEMAEFARQAYAMGCNYIGGCCGTAPHHVRAMAEALGRRPEASKYSVDMTKHAFFGTDPSLKPLNQEYATRL
jgi:betaine-homocysteine S-methyltransferase